MSAEYNTGDIDDTASLRVIARALDLGVTLFDTADVYGPFANELLVGRGIRARAADVVVATKVGLVQDAVTGHVVRSADPGHIRASCEASLRRLGVAAIGVYYLHRVDPAVPLEASLGRDGGSGRRGEGAGARAVGGVSRRAGPCAGGAGTEYR